MYTVSNLKLSYSFFERKRTPQGDVLYKPIRDFVESLGPHTSAPKSETCKRSSKPCPSPYKQ